MNINSLEAIVILWKRRGTTALIRYSTVNLGDYMVKPSTCKVCNSPFVKEIDIMLSKGISYPVIVNFLKDKSTVISSVSVGRHNNNHRIPSLGVKPKTTKKSSKKSTKKPKRKKGKAKQAMNSGDYETREQRNLAAFERDLSQINKRRKKVLKNVMKLEKDFNILDELELTVQLAKDRMFRAIEEEQDTKMVIPVTSHAIKDHIQAIKVYAEASAGMNKTEFNFAQMVNVVGDIFALPALSDKAKSEMLSVIDQFGINEVEPLPEVIDITEETKDSNSKPEVVQILPIVGKKPSKDLPKK